MENSMNDELERRVDCTWLGTSFSITQNVQIHETMRSSVVVVWVAAAREPLWERMRRSGRLSEAIAGWNEEVGTTADPHNVTCAEDATMSEGKQCVQRDVTGSRCLEDGCGKNMLHVCLRTSVASVHTSLMLSR